MPVTNGIGHSKETPNKQFGLDAILRMHANIVKAVLSKHPYFPQTYYYIDMNSGDGSNPEEGVSGSPLVFRDVIEQVRMPYYAHFIELVPGNVLNLRIALSGWNHNTIHPPMDNKVVLPIVLKDVPRNAYGLIYNDPNNVPDFELLAEVSNTHKRLDILMRYSGSAHKRMSKKLAAEIKRINKQILIVRDLTRGDHWQWTFLFMTNYTDMKAWHSKGFYKSSEPRGKDILEKLNYTREELIEREQPSLFVIERSGGVCEKCALRPATVIHHMRYEGTAMAEDMLHVCDQCHCTIHGKDN